MKKISMSLIKFSHFMKSGNSSFLNSLNIQSKTSPVRTMGVCGMSGGVFGGHSCGGGLRESG